VSRRVLCLAGGLVLLALVPPVAAAIGTPFYVDVFRRIMIFAIAAVSLDLILGYGGMVSFGHAVYLGIGAYAVGIPAFYGVDNGYLQWTIAVGSAAAAALVIGAISLRTSGVYFIMITLAFSQMLYYLANSVEEYGGDDGMRLAARSAFPGLVDLRNGTAFYYVVLGVLVVTLLLGHRIVNSRFGMVIRGARSNDARMRAIGFSSFRYRLVAFVIAGAMCGLAGALLVNHTDFVTPEFMNWTRSGDIMFMVILGGMGTLGGPVLGAVVLRLLEDLLLPAWTEHWQAVLGPFLVLVVLFARGGLAGLLPERRDG
jgi:branched-chain amino acid transport system permease protein